MFDVYITGASKFLPNEAVSNDEIEQKLGFINGKPSKAKNIILRNNKIVKRYYALDENSNSTHSNAELTKQAIEDLQNTHFSLADMQVLSCGTSTPDQLLPSHSAMVHGLLKNHSLELNSSSGVCCAGMNALKYGYLSVKSGNSENAVCTGSEKVSTWLQANRFEHEAENLKKLEEQPVVAFKKDFLRWMLSDGAGAFLLQNKPVGDISLKIEWMDFYSYAFELETCMYAGGDKQEDGSIKPWNDYKTQEWLEQSVFSIKQDVKVLDENILEKGALSMREALNKNKVSVEDITYFLPHVSSGYFVDKLHDKLVEFGIGIPKEKWFMNLPYVGNVGSASIYLMLEELMYSSKLKKGNTVLLSVPESGRFSYAYAYLTVV
ncbi:MAG TPA: beta-ketoacyl-ACP synthase III [Flavobacterium sp.]|nr:beta-ketoacyl-ACP synthase III [Flavobacterium sp.]